LRERAAQEGMSANSYTVALLAGALHWRPSIPDPADNGAPLPGCCALGDATGGKYHASRCTAHG
jgi:hypothetical protein